jgi:hypothetical protein
MLHADAARRAEVERSLAAALAEEEAVVFAYLHGSFLTAPGFHDVDVAVYLGGSDAGAHTDICLDLASGLSAIVRLPVDVRALGHAPVSFRFHALRGRLLTCRDDEVLMAVLEDTMRRYFDLEPVLRRAAIDAFAT